MQWVAELGRTAPNASYFVVASYRHTPVPEDEKPVQRAARSERVKADRGLPLQEPTLPRVDPGCRALQAFPAAP